MAADAIKQIGATIKTIDPATGQITATDTAKKLVTISVRPATKVKRLDDPTAQTIARIVNPSYQGPGGGRGGRGGGGGRAREPERVMARAPRRAVIGGQAGGGAPGGAAGGRAGGGRGRGGAGQIQTLIDQQPDIKVVELKPGEPIIVSGPNSGDSFAAMMVLAGVDPDSARRAFHRRRSVGRWLEQRRRRRWRRIASKCGVATGAEATPAVCNSHATRSNFASWYGAPDELNSDRKFTGRLIGTVTTGSPTKEIG